ncbi:MAG: hypothetical protein HOV81_28175 [Kofleriaceae bacterium]|nr:hypothetical protein [Kofleriaceae bacterium]
MSRPIVVLELAGQPALARDLAAGGVFVPGCTLAMNQECDLVLRGGGRELTVGAQCVWVDGTRGSGLQLIGCDGELKQQIAEMAEVVLEPRTGSREIPLVARTTSTELAAESRASTIEIVRPSEADASDEPVEDEPVDDDDGTSSSPGRKIALNIHARLRGLTLVQQIKVAQHGEASERIVLERMYGKNVWDPILRNPRVTSPEVARIARMGALPRPLLELIVGNGAWLQVPEIRRALLSNTRLQTDQILRVLRLLPKHELKLAALQTAYPVAVRDAAKRMIKDAAGG